MSTDWNIRCRDCDEVHGFDDANHREDLMAVLIEHAAAIAALAPLLKATSSIASDVELRTPWGAVDVDWFAKHLGHRLVPHDEYGRDLGQCWKSVPCSECKCSHRPCTLALDHEGGCTP